MQPENPTVRQVDEWYRTGTACPFCRAAGLCRHREIDADIAALRALQDAISCASGPERKPTGREEPSSGDQQRRA